MKIFISGATGFVGGHLCKELLQRGHELRLLAHRAKTEPSDRILYVQGDVTCRDDCIKGAAGCNAVINLVGIIREFPGNGTTFQKLHIEATANMIAAARENGISRYLQMSALGSRPGAASNYHSSKYSAEELLYASGLYWTIFRPSLIFGPKDAFVNMLAGFINKLSMVPIIGDGAYRLQPISADDVARCFALALEKPETIGKSYNLCGRDRFTYVELVDTIARVMGRAYILKIKNPLFLMKIATTLFERLPFYPVTTDQITMLLEESICDGTWQQTFGFEPVRFEEGVGTYLRQKKS
ncbi:MAG: complex I NDUFA9 subunit family protein [Geobacteraceae bacterium]|nr:complex I NDUFA9 subunit family protein [Geobacteraceae bacterium]